MGTITQLTFAEDARAAYDAWLQQSDECLFVVAVLPEGSFSYEAINPAYERATGLRLQDVIGKRPQDCLTSDLAEAVVTNFRQCLEAGASFRYEATLNFPSGVRYWQTVLTPVRSARGDIYRILGSARDRTSEVQASQFAEASHGLLQSIIDACPDIIYVIDLLSCQVITIGSRVEQVLGYSVSDVTAWTKETLNSLVHPDDAIVVAGHRAWTRRMNDGVLATTEYRVQSASGNYTSLSYREAIFARDPDGRATKILGIATSIEQQKEAERSRDIAYVNLRRTLDSITDCYFTLDHEFRVTDVNSAFVAWAGRHHDQLKGKNFWDLCRPTDDCGSITQKAIDHRRSRHAEIRSALRPDRWLDYHVYPTPAGGVVFFHDITDRKLAEQEAQKSRGLLSATLDGLSAHIAILNENGVIIGVNSAWRRFADERGYDMPDHGIGLKYVEICRIASDTARALIISKIQAVLSGRRNTASLEFLCGNRWYQMHANRFARDGAIYVVAAHEDITELVTARESLRELDEKLLTLQEEERRRIASDLHDSTTQHLVGAQLNLTHVRNLVPDRLDLQEHLQQAERSLNDAHREIRSFAYLLYPPMLDTDGLAATLSQYVDGFNHRTGLLCTLSAQGDVDSLPLQVQRSVLRIIQEALTNVHRHADATKASVELRVIAKALHITISDNGTATGHASAPTTLGIGIKGMQARARQLDGRLTVKHQKRGTRVKAVIPIFGACAASPATPP
jgi:PAS domain S-box-containing protein